MTTFVIPPLEGACEVLGNRRPEAVEDSHDRRARSTSQPDQSIRSGDWPPVQRRYHHGSTRRTERGPSIGERFGTSLCLRTPDAALTYHVGRCGSGGRKSPGLLRTGSSN